MEMETIKCVVVGDSAVGKTPLITTFQTRRFKEDSTPTICDNFSKLFEINGKLVNFEFWDTSGLEEYDHLRPLAYPGTNVFLVCFTLECPTAIERVAAKWCPEIQENCPDTPFILVGTKMDIRDRTCRLEKVIQSRAKGKAVAQNMGAVDYMECSALANVGLDEIFYEAARLTLWPNEERQKGCNIL